MVLGTLVAQKRRLSISQSRRRKWDVVFEVKYFKYTLFVYILLPHRRPQTDSEILCHVAQVPSAREKMLTGDGGMGFAVSSFQVARSLKALRANRQGHGPEFPLRPRREKRGAQGEHPAAAFRTSRGWRLQGRTIEDALDFKMEI